MGTTNPKGSCLSSLKSISKNSENYRNIFSVETFSCSCLHAKSKKSRFSQNFNKFLSSVPQPEPPSAKKKQKKSKKEMPIRYIGPIIAAHIAMRKEKKMGRFSMFRRLLFCISNNT